MIGIVTALEKEFVAMAAMLDDVVDYVAPGAGAGRKYSLGHVPASNNRQHTVVLALAADMGNNLAAVRASLMLQHFPSLKNIVMVGIAGGVPNPTKPDEHVRLGDVVVSDESGVVQYDFETERYDYKTDVPVITPRRSPRPPSAVLLEAVRLTSASEKNGLRTWLRFIERARDIPDTQRPPDETDRMYASDDPTHLIPHPFDPQRVAGQPRVFHGTIASANILLRNPKLRDELRDGYGVKALEMESSGIVDAAFQYETGYLVVRGICDYCDSQKNDAWQGYAAVVAAAYTRGLMVSMPTEDEKPISSGAVSRIDTASLRRQLDQARDNLALIEERRSQYVLEIDMPLQLIKEERRLKSQIAELEKKLS